MAYHHNAVFNSFLHQNLSVVALGALTFAKAIKIFGIHLILLVLEALKTSVATTIIKVTK